MSRDRGGDDRSWQTTGVWEGSTEQHRVTQAALAAANPEPPRCPRCGYPAGTHGLVHNRYPEGGGGSNTPCPNTPTPEGEN